LGSDRDDAAMRAIAETYTGMQSLTWSEELFWTLDIACSRMLPVNVNAAMIVVGLVR
jgi:hypothetical protein